MTNRITDIKHSTEPAFLPNVCYPQFFLPKVGYIFTEKFVSKDVVTVSLIKNGNIDKMHNISRTIWNITIKECKQIRL